MSDDQKKLYDRIASIDPINRQEMNTCDDISAGLLYATTFRDSLRFNETANKWYVYDGKRWTADPNRTAEVYAENLARALWAYSNNISSKDFLSWVYRLQNTRGRKAMMEDARKHLSAQTTDFDKESRFFNCQNGVLDLDKHTFIKHDPALMLSRISNVIYNPDAHPETVLKFTDEIMSGDKAKTCCLQDFSGYAMLGTNERETSVFLHGPKTRNGKGTFSNTMLHLFGDYGGVMQPESLALQRYEDGRTATPDMAGLYGVRYLQVSEPKKNMVLDVQKFKAITGRDEIKARWLHENPFTFTPGFALFLNTNWLPTVTDQTIFSSDRIHIITFDRHFSDEERDPNLKDRLVEPENLSALLNWMLEGLKRYHANGSRLTIPECVKNATAAYQGKSDKIQNFFDDCLEENPFSTVKAGDVYQRFADWCRDSGFGVDSKGSFFDELRRKDLLEPTGRIDGNTYHNVITGYQLEAIRLST